MMEKGHGNGKSERRHECGSRTPNPARIPLCDVLQLVNLHVADQRDTFPADQRDFCFLFLLIPLVLHSFIFGFYDNLPHSLRTQTRNGIMANWVSKASNQPNEPTNTKKMGVECRLAS